MHAQVPTSVLKIVREAAGFGQVDLARSLEVNQSVVSRLEATEFTDPQMARRYLTALGTGLSKEALRFYNQSWRFSERPSFLHPDRDALRAAEEALQVLDTFESSEKFDEILQDPLSKLRNRLLNEADYIRHSEHGLAFIGDIGVGKTTALSFAMNLDRE